jgi:hypothetical protein
VVVCFLGRNEPPADEDGLQFARGTKEAALKAVLLTGIKKESLDLHPLNWPLIEEVRARLTHSRSTFAACSAAARCAMKRCSPR